MYETFDRAIEQLDPTCFAKCDQPHNVTSKCYLSCYNTAVNSATKDQLTAPWEVAFSTCPPLHIDEVQKLLTDKSFIENSLKTLMQ